MAEIERKPAIRFAGFTEVWEQCKLKELIRKPVADGPHETPIFVNDGIPFLSVEAIHDGIIDLSKARGMISKEDDERFKQKYIPEKELLYKILCFSKNGIFENILPTHFRFFGNKKLQILICRWGTCGGTFEYQME